MSVEYQFSKRRIIRRKKSEYGNAFILSEILETIETDESEQTKLISHSLSCYTSEGDVISSIGLSKDSLAIVHELTKPI